jgi:hypothetical protein
LLPAFGGYLRALGLVQLPALVTGLPGKDMGSTSWLLVRITADDRVEVKGTAAALCKMVIARAADPRAGCSRLPLHRP